MEMMKANLDDSVLIKESAKYVIHVQMESRNVNPANPQDVRVGRKIAVFTPKEFEDMERLKEGMYKIDWVKAAGFYSARVVHDGRLLPKEEVIQKSEQELDNDNAERVDFRLRRVDSTSQLWGHVARSPGH